MDVVTDWRGTPITEGATVVYGATVGRSVAMVQGKVDGFTPTGRVWVEVVHRSYGGWGHAPRVHVGADRLTIVAELPPTELPTEAERAAQAKADRAGYYQRRLDELVAGTGEPAHVWETPEVYRELIART